MTTVTLTPGVPHSRRLTLTLAVRAVRAFGGAAVNVVLLGVYEEEAGVRNPRPQYAGRAG
ncbi:hypothetical protein [Streptomyces sp. NBC_01353]|uniref:hypothetical protein n=1 Tax=Streptomyces sp. NBC_01353 TaxID=2903835 RepID=UPI002E340D12|nr:hypothetical protein [Streptomyces sp. NBC_01353]